MPGCNIIGCSRRRRKIPKNLTFHRLPRNEVKKRMWLNIIGTENLRRNTKEIFICSLHFEESDFNRTLGILKLQDEALPRLSLPQRKKKDTSVSSVENDATSSLVKHGASNLHSVQSAPNNNNDSWISSDEISRISVEAEDEEDIFRNQFLKVPTIHPEPVSSASKDQTIKKLRRKCQSQRNEIKRLTEIVRTQKRKIANYTNIIKILTKES